MARRFPPPAWAVYVLYTPTLTHSAILNPQLISLPSICDVRRHLESRKTWLTSIMRETVRIARHCVALQVYEASTPALYLLHVIDAETPNIKCL
jgi:hypothetical protein